MIPDFFKTELESWISGKFYGEIKITFQGGNIQRWTTSVSKLPPSNSSGSIKNPGEHNPASQGDKLEV